MDLKKLYIKENEFLNLHKNYLSYFKQDNFTERCLKEINWEKNSINRLYLDSNSTYFWICYDKFWKDLKYKLQFPWEKNTLHELNFLDTRSSTNIVPEFQLTHINNAQLNDLFLQLNVFYLKLFLVNHFDLLKYLISIFYFGIFLLVGYVLYNKGKFVYNCYKTKTLKVTFLNWLFDKEILFTISNIGIFYSITIILLLGLLYNYVGFIYWFTYLFCGRVFIWNWLKFGLYKLNKKYNLYKI